MKRPTLNALFLAALGFSSATATPVAYRVIRPMPLETFARAQASRAGVDVSIDRNIASAQVSPQLFPDPQPEAMMAAAATQVGAAFTVSAGGWTISKPQAPPTASSPSRAPSAPQPAAQAQSGLVAAPTPQRLPERGVAKSVRKPHPKTREREATPEEIRRQIRALEAKEREARAAAAKKRKLLEQQQRQKKKNFWR